MKKYIRDIIDEIRQPKNSDFIPSIPKPSTVEANTVDLNAPEPPVQPDDLENQELSTDPAERVRQLDQQAQDNDVREQLE